MKNHFYISYFGNKREEVEHFYNLIDFSNIETVIEPFCGTSAISYYIWTKHPNMKFILNDNNKYLYDMYEIIKDDEKLKEFEKTINEVYLPKIKTKVGYDNLMKEKSLYSWFISYKYFNIRPTIYPLGKTIKPIDLKASPIYNFYKNGNIIFTYDDVVPIYEKYKDNDKNLIILDPPYLNCCNNFYEDAKTNIYEYLYENNIKDNKAKIFLILENIWIIKMLFKGQIISSYNKVYNTTYKKTKHIIINNKYKN